MSAITEKYIFGQTDGDGNFTYDIKPKSIYEFFSVTSIKKIPAYQRPYSWTQRHVEALLNDIKAISQSDSEERAWYLGPIYITKKSTADNFNLLLDGQQRITTLQIILREITLFEFHDDSRLTEDRDLMKKFKGIIEQCKTCIMFYKNGNPTPVFETESIANEVFSNYILGMNEVTSSSEFKDKINEYEHAIHSKYEEGSKTALTLLNHMTYIRKFIQTEFCAINDYNKSLSEIINFANTVLQKFWLIEIPLKEKDFSIEIFEAINNRGKGLTLVDKLQFKSLLKPVLDRDITRGYWKEIYVDLEKLTTGKSKKIFGSHEEFFKILFLSIKSSEIKDDEIIQFFESNYTNNEKNLKAFFNRVKIALRFFIDIQTCLGEKNGFVLLYKNGEQEKIKSLLQVLKMCLSVSDNTRQLLFDMININAPYTKVNGAPNYSVLIGIWNIIKIVFYAEIVDSDGSNNIRKDFNKLISGIRTTDYSSMNYTNLIKMNIDIRGDGTELEPLLAFDSINLVNQNQLILTPSHLLDHSSLLRTKSNEKAKLILYIYCHLTNHTQLSRFNQELYDTSDLEHTMPHAWSAHWNDKNYSVENATDAIDLITKKFVYLDKENIKLKIKTLDQFTLIPYIKKPMIQINSLVEWIGNKWVLHNLTNRGLKHNNYDTKLSLYRKQDVIKIPSNDSVIGYDRYDDFGHRDIIERSFIIVDKLASDFFKSDWDDI